MTTNLESLKAEYLSEFNRSIPRLKELAIALRAGDGHTSQSGEFWDLTSDPKTNYELYQVAQDLSSLDEFWESIPDNPQSSPNAQEGDRPGGPSLAYELNRIAINNRELQARLHQVTAILNLLKQDLAMKDDEVFCAIEGVLSILEGAFDDTDRGIGFALSHIKELIPFES